MATGLNEFRPGIAKWGNWKEVLDSYFLKIAVEEDKMKVSTQLKVVGSLSIRAFKGVLLSGFTDYTVLKKSSRYVIFGRNKVFSKRRKRRMSQCLRGMGE